MRIGRIAIPVAAAVSVLLAAGPAAAQPVYPPTPPDLTVTPATIVVGETVTEIGDGYGPNELVTITISFNGGGGAGGGGSVQPGRMGGSAIASRVTQRLAPLVRANSAGDFTTTDQLNQVGTATITATGATTGLSDSATVTVLAAGAAMPRTSSTSIDLGKMLLAGGAAVAVGAALVLLSIVWRRRLRSARV